eukprot:XP_001709610.1 Hypothetical protein GL50803_94909 [Giardia lamblia ATCC 50803]
MYTMGSPDTAVSIKMIWTTPLLSQDCALQADILSLGSVPLTTSVILHLRPLCRMRVLHLQQCPLSQDLGAFVTTDPICFVNQSVVIKQMQTGILISSAQSTMPSLPSINYSKRNWKVHGTALLSTTILASLKTLAHTFSALQW